MTLAAVLALVGAGCSSGDDGAGTRPGVSEQHAVRSGVQLHVVGADEVSPHKAFGPLEGGTAAAATAVVQRTFDATVARPLTGGRPGSLDKVFSPDAAARATGPDRAALFDENLPDVGRMVADKADVRLTGLDGVDGRPAMVVARIDWDVRSGDRSVRVQRVGELTLVPVFGTWLVNAYTVFTNRIVGSATTTTTAATP